MESFINLAPVVTGAWLIIVSLWISANSNFLSAMIFKVVPFFLGLASLFSGGKLMGWF